MTTGFQHQQQQVNFSFPKTVRQPQQVGRKLDAAPPPAAPVRTPVEPRAFK